MSTQEEEKGFFDKLGEILNSSLPGTEQQPLPKGAEANAPADEEDEDSIFDRIREVLESPLPGTGVEETAGPEQPVDTESAVASPSGEAQAGGVPASKGETAGTKTDVPDWYRQELAVFHQHQGEELKRLEARQAQELAAFQRYQENQKANFETHQSREQAAFERHQASRLEAWQQMSRGASPPGVSPQQAWPPGMPPPPGWRPGMPFPPAPPPGWHPHMGPGGWPPGRRGKPPRR